MPQILFEGILKMKQKKEKSNANVFRIHKDKNFVVMSNRHLFDKPPLSLKAKGLLSVLLALPDDWNYSINGLTAISKESRDCICATLKELQNFGYVEIEQTRTKGMFGAIYHIYEIPQKKNTESENPNRLNRIGKTESENPIQINNNNQDIKNENNNIIVFDENASVFGVQEIFNLYKKICSIYPQPRFLTVERIANAEKRLLKFPDESFWTTAFQNVVKSEFCKKSNFVSFDWFIKNNTNALKAFEGNYNKNNDSNAAIDLNKYANYCSNQKAAQNA